MRIFKPINIKYGTACLLFFIIGTFLLTIYNRYLDMEQKRQLYEEKVVYYESISEIERRWIRSNQVSNGALSFYKETSGNCNAIPYFSNIAASSILGGTFVKEDKKTVQEYLAWYLSHLNRIEDDPVNGEGSIYDYDIVTENDKLISETSKGKYDSVDSYSATFLILLRNYYERTEDIEYLTGNADHIIIVIQAMLNTIDSDGLGMTNNNDRIKYLMDNVEVNKGLKDSIFLIDTVFQAEQIAQNIDDNKVKKLKDDLEKALENNTKAIESLWNQSNQHYEIGLNKQNETLEYKGWQNFYPDAVLQLFPIVFGVIEPNSERAQLLYDRFCSQYKWEVMEHFNSDDTDFYWCILVYVSSIMQDETRVEKFFSYYRDNIMKEHEYPLYIAESGWCIMACDKMIELYTN